MDGSAQSDQRVAPNFSGRAVGRRPCGEGTKIKRYELMEVTTMFSTCASITLQNELPLTAFRSKPENVHACIVR
jgi:hypothetical protein